MTKKELEKLLLSKESPRVEKTVSTTDMDKFQEAICTFSNDMDNSRQNGYLIIGAKDNGELSGLRVDDHLFKKISGIRSYGNILPIPMMTCERYELEEGDLLIVEVQPSFSPPVRYRGRTFIRIGPRRDIATIDEERILTEKRVSNMATFDALPCYRANLKDVDLDFIKNEYIPEAVSEKALTADTRTIEELLSSLALYDMTHRCPTNACIVLFGKNPLQFLPGAYVQYVFFDGQDRGAEIKAENSFKEGLAMMIPKLEAFIDYGIVQSRPVAVSTFRERTQSNYPAEALRELILNACMHRDYQSNMPTRFYEYKAHIEITNPGGLYGKARPENFPNINDYRNPIIAQALKVLGYVNMFNRGIRRVQDIMRNNGSREPIFDVSKVTAFEVTCFPVIERQEPTHRKSLGDENIEGIISKLIPIHFKENERETLEAILSNLRTPRSTNELANILSISRRTIKDKYLKTLIRNSIIRMTIPDKPTSMKQQYVLSFVDTQAQIEGS